MISDGWRAGGTGGGREEWIDGWMDVEVIERVMRDG